jgi:hypothetical protein
VIIIVLVPLAPRGVRDRPSSASSLLTRNLWIYGLRARCEPAFSCLHGDPRAWRDDGLGDLLCRRGAVGASRGLICGM